MTEFDGILNIVNKNQGVVILAIGWLVWRMKINDLPHMLEELQKLGQRIASLEGRKRGR